MTQRFFSRAGDAGFKIPNLTPDKTYFPHTQCLILNGKTVANILVEQCQHLGSTLLQKPKLAVILIGENPASKIYVNNKINTFKKAHFISELFTFAQTITQQELIECIHSLNHDPSVHGILVQLPLPAHLNQEEIFSAIDSRKDVDGFSTQNMGRLALSHPLTLSACTPFGIMMLLAAYEIDVVGKNCVVVGRSAIVGKPMGLMLLNANATVTFVHSHTKNRQECTQQADILIVAAGKKHLISKADIKNHAIVIDVGIHKNSDGTLTGDVHPNVKQRASALTPVPGGVGPMTIAALLLNTVLAAI